MLRHAIGFATPDGATREHGGLLQRQGCRVLPPADAQGAGDSPGSLLPEAAAAAAASDPSTAPTFGTVSASFARPAENDAPSVLWTTLFDQRQVHYDFAGAAKSERHPDAPESSRAATPPSIARPTGHPLLRHGPPLPSEDAECFALRPGPTHRADHRGTAHRPVIALKRRGRSFAHNNYGVEHIFYKLTVAERSSVQILLGMTAA